MSLRMTGFIWHFKDRADFFRQLIEYWDKYFTQSVITEISDQRGPAEERFSFLSYWAQSKKKPAEAGFFHRFRRWADLFSPVSP